MDQIEFADGFDRPDQIAFGLGAGQLGMVMAGALAAYSLVRSPLPAAFADPVAVLVATVAAGLAWIRVAGRPALDWAMFAGFYLMRPRRGTARRAAGPDAPAPSAAPEPPAQQAPIIELFGAKATPPVRAASTVARAPRRDGPRRVTFFSLRGGTGRSTLATELACLLAASRSDDHPAPRVALVDLDLRSPTVGIRLGTPEKTLLDYALAPPRGSRGRRFHDHPHVRCPRPPRPAARDESRMADHARAAARGTPRARHGRVRPRRPRRVAGVVAGEHGSGLRMR
jgi:hypothetical protein